MFRSLSRLPGRNGRSVQVHCLATFGKAPSVPVDRYGNTREDESHRPSHFKSNKKTAPDRANRFDKSSRSNQFTASPSNRIKATGPLDKRTKSTEPPSSEPSNEVASLLSSIASEVTKLSCDELEAIHKKIFNLYHSSTGRAAPKSYQSMESLLNSPVYGRLLEVTDKRMQQFNAGNLATVFQSASSFDYDGKQTELIKRTMQALRGQLKQLDLEQLFACLNSANYNMRDLKLLRGTVRLKDGDVRELANVFRFSQELLAETKSRILSDKFEDTEMLVKNIQIFLRPLQFDEEMITYFAEQLCRPQIKLTYLQSTILLGKIKKAYLMYEQFRGRVESTDLMQSDEFVDGLRERTNKFSAAEYLPKCLASLIDKCNDSIYASFKSKPDARDIEFHLSVLHDTAHPINNEFDNFYDRKLLHDFLAPHLMRSRPSDNHRRNLLRNLTFNYYFFQRCDERLLRLVYDSICRQPGEWRRLKEICYFYSLFAKYRLPFVDERRLVDCLLDASDTEFEKALKKKTTSIELLCDLLLNDVTNEALYDLLDRKIENLKGNFKIYNRMKKRLYAKICLVKVYLSMFELLEGEMKQRISTRLDAVLANVVIAGRQPTISSAFIRINSRLQGNGYLSNGLYLDAWAIYDKSTQDLIPLSGYDFHKIDQIPLTSDQQLLTFVMTEYIEGHRQKFEQIYGLKLTQVLERLKIRVFSVPEKVIENLDVEQRIDFYIQTVLDYYK